MRGPLVVGGAVALGMFVALAYGFVAGGGWDEVARAWAFPWFRVTVVDVYAGLLLVAAWAWHRERSPVLAALWTIVFAATGNLGAGIYVITAAARSNGDWTRFWSGAPRD